MNAEDIVVGVDGSEDSRAALVYALGQARDRAARVRVVSAYDRPRYWSLPVGMPINITEAEIADRVRADTLSMVDQVLADEPNPVEVTVSVVPGSASEALVEASRSAGMLVVGHRGRGGLNKMVVGSVALRCVLHAECSVTVVRPPER